MGEYYILEDCGMLDGASIAIAQTKEDANKLFKAGCECIMLLEDVERMQFQMKDITDDTERKRFLKSAYDVIRTFKGARFVEVRDSRIRPVREVKDPPVPVLREGVQSAGQDAIKQGESTGAGEPATRRKLSWD